MYQTQDHTPELVIKSQKQYNPYFGGIQSRKEDALPIPGSQDFAKNNFEGDQIVTELMNSSYYDKVVNPPSPPKVTVFGQYPGVFRKFSMSGVRNQYRQVRSVS